MRRCRHDIVECLLRALSSRPMRITELCRVCNIPVDRGKPLLEKMISYGLIFVVEGVYHINEIGYEWLGVYSHLKELMGEFESRPWI